MKRGGAGDEEKRPAAALDAGQRRRWRWEEVLTTGPHLSASGV
jgi:hypothetical protein